MKFGRDFQYQKTLEEKDFIKLKYQKIIMMMKY
jgi:hypothetical protein